MIMRFVELPLSRLFALVCWPSPPTHSECELSFFFSFLCPYYFLFFFLFASSVRRVVCEVYFIFDLYRFQSISHRQVIQFEHFTWLWVKCEKVVDKTLNNIKLKWALTAGCGWHRGEISTWLCSIWVPLLLLKKVLAMRETNIINGII